MTELVWAEYVCGPDLWRRQIHYMSCFIGCAEVARSSLWLVFTSLPPLMIREARIFNDGTSLG